MPHEELSYINLNQKLLRENVDEISYNIDNHEYIANRGKGGMLGSPTFLFITDISDDKASPSADGKELKRGKLKFHVSLPEQNRVHFAQGWDIVKDILIDNGVRSFKVVHEDERMSEGDGSQRGKDITIYTEYNPEKSLLDWQNIIQAITNNLVAENIPPGYETAREGPRADLAITGCKYVSYRYEKTDYMEQVLVGKIDNRCRNMIINVDNQPNPQFWQPAQQVAQNAILNPNI